MSPAEYLDLVKERLLTDPIVARFQIRRERTTVVDGHIRVRAILSDGSLLEFSEYVQRTQHGSMQVIVYSYHWESANGDLIRRWDNTPHYPDLPSFPHHVHDGQTGTTQPGRPMDIFAALDQISQLLAQNS
ncbi:MAG: DUF6516 family protein [Chloroflexota bacterium]|jgi:hypothetical protein|nr:DUF6516 family protein [Chloroflexota bacterium]